MDGEEFLHYIKIIKGLSHESSFTYENISSRLGQRKLCLHCHKEKMEPKIYLTDECNYICNLL